MVSGSPSLERSTLESLSRRRNGSFVFFLELRVKMTSNHMLCLHDIYCIAKVFVSTCCFYHVIQRVIHSAAPFHTTECKKYEVTHGDCRVSIGLEVNVVSHEVNNRISRLINKDGLSSMVNRIRYREMPRRYTQLIIIVAGGDKSY